ncbi:hypothetical protein HJC23_001858 [Cyclotella cryptica]|uniref:Uncharacterized protein n=1 Tax=Cyclotella cryptica TaxID=29204 RepID=A0ABD3Q5B0_9STRA
MRTQMALSKSVNLFNDTEVFGVFAAGDVTLGDEINEVWGEELEDTNDDYMSEVTPHEMGPSDDESEVAVEPEGDTSLGQLALDLWNSS